MMYLSFAKFSLGDRVQVGTLAGKQLGTVKHLRFVVRKNEITDPVYTIELDEISVFHAGRGRVIISGEQNMEFA